MCCGHPARPASGREPRPVGHYPHAVATLRLFAAAREAAGTGRDDVPGTTVAEVLDAARARYGAPFTDVLTSAAVWLNGEPVEPGTRVDDADEVAVLPPVSGGQA